MPSTTIAGMAHYEMLVSHSPPVFSHSPPASFLNDYGPNVNRYFDPSRSLCRSQSLTPIQSRQKFHQLASKMPTVPKRPCLVVKSEQMHKSDTENETKPHNDNKAKKRVVFADDKGKSLTEIRVMSEPSNVPPLWSIEFLSHVTQGFITPDITDEWSIAFKQPASDYLNFRQKLDTKNVSLENVIIKESESRLVGTVKVKNLSFTKEVIVRSTWNNWKTQQDTICTFTPICGGGGSYVLYDTFSFKLTLPPSSVVLEFCVCYRVDGVEHWDNNEGKNYKLIKKRSSFASHSPAILLHMEEQKINAINMYSGLSHQSKSPTAQTNPISIPAAKYNDLTQSKMTSYSEFASWNHLDHECPYW
ncbi:protein phosphatase 1 regulatory subunit 3B [Sitodiplosis mosellana]|uniref:protein phosphatase 1 regulatory subunit 3B n=1 Tax=Sitodiplosis mosellana TaxID=263140 RepID=UPI002443DE58|nr:protein phosphatase 1 regulatory subunit 3B [Sitodiplosis mosellana]XP_055306004.1 protein phosphatase 1 regulatory subunit 3B [Sitodiplosis mosellana]